MIRALPRAALLVLLVAGLTGCASSVDMGQPSDSPTESPEAPALGNAIDDRCDGLISPVDYEGLWSGDLEPLGYSSYGAATAETLSATALVQSDALICGWWSDEADIPAALMFVMGDGEDGFRRTEATFAAAGSPYTAVPILDGAYIACRGEGIVTCHWNVLHGSDWISLMIVDVAVDDVAVGADLSTTAPARLVSALAEAVEALDIPRTRSATPAADCIALLSPGDLVEPLGVEAARITVIPSPPLEEASIESSSPEFGQVMWKYAYEMLGYSGCGVQIDGHLVGVVIIATDSAWVLQDSSAQQPKLEQIDDHGDGVKECTPNGSSTSCTVAFASGDDLLLAQFAVPSELDGAAIALAALELLLA